MQALNPGSSRSEQIARALVVGLLCSVPALLCIHGAAGCVADPDIGWHLRTGEWITQHHAFPHSDPFSRVDGGAPWQAYSWLFELILLRLYFWFNLGGVVVYTAAMIALITAAVYHMVSRLQSDFSQCALITLAVSLCICRLGTPRPWLFTILFFALELDILMHARRTGKSRELLWLPLIFALWANVHIQFVDGLLVIAVAAVEPLIARWWKSPETGVSARYLLLALAASIAAVCVNPYGIGIYKIAWKLGSQPGVLDTVSEMLALPFRSPLDFLLLFLALAAAGVLFRYRQLPPFETLMLAMAAVLSFRSRRDLWFMAITAAMILAAGVPARKSWQNRKNLSAWAWPISAAAAALFLMVGGRLLHVNNAHLHSLQAEKMPVHAVEIVKQRHYAGPLFNTYDWGGFLIWDLREPVSIDGRAALYGDQLLDRSRDTWRGGPKWASDPDLQSAAVVIAPIDAALTQLLKTDGRFQVTYEDKVAAVFVAKNALPTPDTNVAALPAERGKEVPSRKL